MNHASDFGYSFAGQLPSTDPHWNPRPHRDLANRSRRAYLDGYAAGYNGCPFLSGQHGDFSDYRTGFGDGQDDARGAA